MKRDYIKTTLKLTTALAKPLKHIFCYSMHALGCWDETSPISEVRKKEVE